jgi:hypothetical protein
VFTVVPETTWEVPDDEEEEEGAGATAWTVDVAADGS